MSLATAANAAADPLATWTSSSGVAIEIEGGPRVALHGFMHAEWVAWDQSSIDELDSSGDPLNDTRFLVRRARVGADLEHGIMSGGLEIDANTVGGPAARLLAAHASIRLPGDDDVPLLAATMGLFKIPVGRATPERVRDRIFHQAPTFVRAYYPGEYDLGAAFWGGYDVFRYVIAAMNGDPIGEMGFGGLDVTASKDLLGRLGVDVELGEAVRITAGTSASFGEGLHPGAPSTKDELTWRDVNENGIVELSELQVIAGAAATPSLTFERFALGGDVAIAFDLPALGEWVVFGELIWAGNLDRGIYVADPVAAGRDLREIGWTVGLVAELGEHARAGVRYDRYDPDADSADGRGGRRVPFDASISTLSAVVEWRPVSFGALSLEYDHNDNARGRGADGAPARLPDDALTLRAAIGF